MGQTGAQFYRTDVRGGFIGEKTDFRQTTKSLLCGVVLTRMSFPHCFLQEDEFRLQPNQNDLS